MVKSSDVLLILVNKLAIYMKSVLLKSPQVAILFPPAAAAFVTGCSCDLLINILLTMYVVIR